jgi:hypothetical protein
MCEVVQRDGCEGGEKSDVQQLYLFASCVFGIAGE